jgi:hypothetical protein
MLRWFYVAVHLLIEAVAARRDARIRFLKAEIEITRRKLGGNRVIPSPEDRARVLAIGRKLNHDVADIIGIVTPKTCCRWVENLRTARIGRPPPDMQRRIRRQALHGRLPNAHAHTLNAGP